MHNTHLACDRETPLLLEFQQCGRQVMYAHSRTAVPVSKVTKLLQVLLYIILVGHICALWFMGSQSSCRHAHTGQYKQKQYWQQHDRHSIKQLINKVCRLSKGSKIHLQVTALPQGLELKKDPSTFQIMLQRLNFFFKMKIYPIFSLLTQKLIYKISTKQKKNTCVSFKTISSIQKSAE